MNWNYIQRALKCWLDFGVDDFGLDRVVYFIVFDAFVYLRQENICTYWSIVLYTQPQQTKTSTATPCFR